jgi:hypothetical protein
MSKYIIIKTVTSTYKCHAYSRKAGRIYFNSRAVNVANVVSITEKDDVISYENKDLTPIVPKRSAVHHCSTLKGAVKCKATTKKARPSSVAAAKNSNAPKRKSSLPDVIEL